MKLKISVAITSKSFSKHSKLRELADTCFERTSYYYDDMISGKRDLIEFLQGHDAAIIGLDKISREVIQSLPQLKAIAKYGVGLDNIDIEAVREHGICLGWKPGINARSVAELTLCFMLGLMRNVFKGNDLLKRMEWRKEGGFQLSGKTIGIIGCGNVGKDVVRLLTPFKCKILVNDIVSYGQFYKEMAVEPVDLKTLLQESEIVTLHVPLDESTHYMINEKTLNNMKSSAYLINTSRGAVVNTNDLKAALAAKIIAGAALDVFENEPFKDKELLSMDNVVVTPHIGGNAEEAVMAMGESAVEHLVRFFS